MARATVNCATDGCNGHMSVTGSNRRDADYRAKNMEARGWTCRDCDNREAAVRAEASGLPALESSEKQVAWAITLRESAMGRVAALMPSALTIRPRDQAIGFYSETLELANLIHIAGEPAVGQVIMAMNAETSAIGWIDTREENVPTKLAGILERLATEEKAMSVEGKAEAAA